MATGQVTKEIVTKSKLDNLANSISTKSGVSTPMTIDQMKVAVEGIISGTKGAIYQDEQGYLVVAKDADIPIQIDSLTVTQDGTYTAPANHAYNPVVVNTAPAPPVYYVKFIDYDGTELYSYTHTQFNALSAMPANPSHTGLVAQGWNWTLAEAKEQILDFPRQNLTIGQLYTTSSGGTQIEIQLDNSDFLTPILSFALHGTAWIDWGDGFTQEQTVSGYYTSRVSIPHEYSSIGTYIIEISVSGNSSYIDLTGAQLNYSTLGILLVGTTSKTRNDLNLYYQEKIKSVRLGNGINNVYYAFKGCKNLTDITVTSSVVFAGSQIFNKCCSLKAIVINNQYNIIGDSNFNSCLTLQKVSLPKNITTIGYDAFSLCKSLQEITIPSSVYQVNDYAFSNCNFKNIEINWLYQDDAYISQYTFSENYNLSSVVFNNFNYQYIPSYCFYKSGIKAIEIPNTVTTINAYAFQLCCALQQVIIPSGVTTIGESAFSNCTSLQQITIPDTVTSLSYGVFFDCFLLQKAVLSNNLTTIPESLFNECYALQQVNIPSGVTAIGSYAFDSCTSLLQLTIPNSVTNIGSSAFQHCSCLYQITLSNNLTSIDTSTFSDCYVLQQVNIPSGVTTIGSYAFNNCYSLRQIAIPNTVTSIGSYAFYYCYQLIKITLPNGITAINSSTFSSCNSLQQINIPNTVTSINTNAFSYCYSLQQITIPSSVTSISNYAFNGCSNMKEYHFLSTTPPTLGGTSVFYGIPSDCIIYVPQGCLSTYQSASNWSTHASKMQEEPT